MRDGGVRAFQSLEAMPMRILQSRRVSTSKIVRLACLWTLFRDPVRSPTEITDGAIAGQMEEVIGHITFDDNCHYLETHLTSGVGSKIQLYTKNSSIVGVG